MLFFHLITLCATMLFTVSTSATEHTLTISSWASPSHSINSRLWPSFIEKIEKATKGRVSAKIVYNLASPSKQLSLIATGGADIGWISHGYHPHRFTAASLVELPGVSGSAEAISVAYWRAYERYLYNQNEYKSLKLLGLMVDGPMQLHSSKPVETLNDIKNLRLRVSGDVSHTISTALGAKSVHVPSSHIKNTLDAKTLDGLLMSLEGRRDFSLNDKVPYVYEISGGFSRSSFALIMNTETFESLPADIRNILDETLFGEALSQLAGQIWDQSDAIGRAATQASEGNKLTKAAQRDTVYFQTLAREERDRIIKKAAKAGLDAKAAVNFIIAESQAYDEAN